ncbi:LCP family protein [Agreia sp.]|uniref:LCP family glycopolymer transferase n=1 Tax=Agreia sp. TaxID=1872416 RepID=UPI0035BBDE68
MKTNESPVRHARSPLHGSWARVLRLGAVVAAVALVSGTSIVAITTYSLTSRIQENSVDIGAEGEAPPPAIGAYEGGFNLLVVGVDNDSGQTDDDGERGDAILNDVNVLLHVSQDHSNAVAVSFPRDLIIPHPECVDPTGGTFESMSARPMNEAMQRGGLPCVVDTVENLTGLDIPFAGVVTFDAVVQMTNAIGGVPICLTGRMLDDNVEYVDRDGVKRHLDLPAGITEISGGEALGFLRSRHGVGDGSDLGRISSQQQYLSSLVRKIKSNETLTDLSKLYPLANVVADNVKLSSSLTNVDTMISMAQALRTIDLDKITFVQYPGTTNDPDFPGKVVPVQSAADQLFALITADQPFQLGADSQGVGSTTEPSAPADPDVPADPEGPVDPEVPVDPATPDAGAPPVLEGVTGSTAQQETCAIPAEG